MTEVDVLIVGQGLAGTCLAWQLYDRGYSFRIIDLGEKSSSKVAAGLYNPVTGRKMVKTWRANQLFPYLIDFYRKREQIMKATFLHKLGIYRPFRSIEEQNEWTARSSENDYQMFIERIANESQYQNVKDELGGIHLKQAGMLDVPAFLAASAKYFSDHIVNDSDSLEILQNDVIYGGIKPKKVIFCRGTYERSDSYFDWLPFAPVKGEILEIEAELDTNTIVNRGVFVIPLAESRYKVGSNYNKKDLTWEPTLEGSKEIEAKLDELIATPYSIVKHKAGVRPATKDRKPFLGMHPKYKNVGIFNGLGAKGVSLAPYFSEHLVNHLFDNSELDKEVNIERYYSLYSEE